MLDQWVKIPDLGEKKGHFRSFRGIHFRSFWVQVLPFQVILAPKRAFYVIFGQFEISENHRVPFQHELVILCRPQHVVKSFLRNLRASLTFRKVLHRFRVTIIQSGVKSAAVHVLLDLV